MPRVLAAATLAITLTACGGLVGNGIQVTQQREIAEFSTLEVHSGIEVVASRGPRALTLTTDENIAPFVETSVRDGRLVLQVRDGFHVFELSPIRVAVSNDRFEGVDASGASRVTVATTPVDTLSVQASGSSIVRASGIGSAAVTLAVSGASLVEVEGQATRLSVDASGASTVRADSLPVASAMVAAHGASTVRLSVSDKVTGHASGSSTVLVDGAGQAAVTTSGGSTVRRAP